MGAEWRRAYDRTSVEAYLHALDGQRAGLLAELEDAEAHLHELRARRSSCGQASRLELSDLAASARAEITRLEDEFRRAVQEVRADASRAIAATRDLESCS